MHKHINDYKLLTTNQSGFRRGDSSVNQLLYITHHVYTAFEDYPTRETRAVYLDISKPFDKVGHDDPVFKLKTYIQHYGSPPCSYSILSIKPSTT